MPGTDLTKYLVPTEAATKTAPPLTAMLMGASLGKPSSYTTVKGETLQSVAQKHHISLDALKRANPTVRLSPTMRMSGGFRLSLPR
jgi:LysM repeat protein